MNLNIKIENGNLICSKHNQEIYFLIMDSQTSFDDALVCQLCLKLNPNISNKKFEIARVKEMLNEEYNKAHKKQTLKLGLQLLQNQILEYKQQVIQQTDAIVSILNQWMSDIEPKSPRNLIQELYQLHQNSKQKAQPHLSVLLNLFKQLFQNQLTSFNIMKNHLISQTKDLYFEQPQVPKKLLLVNTVKQQERCYAIAFDKTGTLMVAGCSEYIKIWKFDKGQIIEQQKLEGHDNSVFCLVFSKKINWFVSCSYRKIMCWKQEGDYWISTQTKTIPQTYIECLILNNNENELISGGDDYLIMVWKVDCQNNQIEYNYTLEKRHTCYIWCLSLNLSETALVSCSNDNRIILWMKGQDQKWEFISEFENIKGNRLSFISDTQILFQHYYANISIVLKSNLELGPKDTIEDGYYFPTIFNRKRQLIIQKHYKYVYIIQKQENYSLKLILEPIDCKHSHHMGQLTDDGEYLIIWNDETKEFRIHQIIY